jgi:hypothetical protein
MNSFFLPQKSLGKREKGFNEFWRSILIFNNFHFHKTFQGLTKLEMCGNLFFWVFGRQVVLQAVLISKMKNHKQIALGYIHQETFIKKYSYEVHLLEKSSTQYGYQDWIPMYRRAQKKEISYRKKKSFNDIECSHQYLRLALGLSNFLFKVFFGLLNLITLQLQVRYLGVFWSISKYTALINVV